jgi:proline dehydrogenase
MCRTSFSFFRQGIDIMLKDTLLYMAQNSHMRDFVTQNQVTRNISRRFVAGEFLDDAVQVTQALNQRGISVALDLLGENVTDVREAQTSAENYKKAIHTISKSGIDANISVKLTALGLDISRDLCLENLYDILTYGVEQGIFVCIDMEGSPYTEQTVDIALETKNRFDCVGTVVQGYLYRSVKDIERLIEQNVRVRLVKGAYKEPAEIAFQQKSDVDENYTLLMKTLLASGNFPAIATHDEGIIAAACDFVETYGISKASFEFQMLYGIRRDVQERLVQQGYNVRVYVPYGSHWYPYLMRRMAERPANLMFVVSNAFR